ncbi:MAG: shikimate dehydrogenase [Alphaproteobacteria bacterium]
MNINGKTELAGVIGYPIEHSKSPLIHNYWFEKYNINGVYVPFAVKPSDFDDVVKNLSKFGFKGVNVTVPHKIRAMELVDILSNEAKKIGAVNTIIVKNDGSLIGHNTDSFGFTQNIEQRCPNQISKGPAVLYGAGGAARAVCSALIDGNCPEIRLVNRTASNAGKLAEIMNCNKIKIVDWEYRSECIDDATLIVNSTSLGLDKSSDLPIELGKLNPKAVVVDIIYNDTKTKFLRRAAVRGNIVIDGLGMLLHQARPSFASWFGIDPEVTEELKELMFA